MLENAQHTKRTIPNRAISELMGTFVCLALSHLSPHNLKVQKAMIFFSSLIRLSGNFHPISELKVIGFCVQVTNGECEERVQKV